ncbi:hypothetical protein A6A04_05315 [Paramagnetospirillum marisnigri]|uniref:Uncharacterized protein n=1 Tax=Paramagnetospirillum marisnigri TaxID=1285242 RepID=A0A178MHH9_9PROT|nr:hypothetical protein [Paramagnetospirillum marisnigri]OAN48171.1 hypothetical protein A6A04_05315 [Paramagnetospirillum marisnigri]
MIAEILPPDSSFSRAVYTEIRPAIPRGQWPMDALRATFMVAPDGLSLQASFEGLPGPAAAIATQVVARAKVNLVLASPVAYLAGSVVRARRWRDTFLYALLPVLFAIPLMAPLGETVMRLTMGLFALDALALILSHGALMQARGRAIEGRFIALIPTPGLRIKVPVGTPLHPQG